METETAVAIVRQNGLSSASCRASVAVTPMCVTADLVNPGGRWPTTGTSPFLQSIATCYCSFPQTYSKKFSFSLYPW